MPIGLAIVLSTLGAGGLWYAVFQLRVTLYHRRRNKLINKKIDELFGPGFGPSLPTGRHRLKPATGRHHLRPHHV
jgi:hypothetical protein